MPPDIETVLNPVLAILLGMGILSFFIAFRAGLQWSWEKLEPDTRDKTVSVLEFMFSKGIDPVDALALIIFVNVALAVVLAMIGLQPLPIAIVVAIGLGTPLFLYSSATGRRAKELELALPLALQQVANEMAAGATLETALKKVAKSAPEPADVEIARLQRRVEVMGIDAAFGEMAERLDSKSFTLVASVVRVGTSSGGRLIEALKNLSQTLIEIERLNKKIRTASENGRRNLYLLSIIGPLIAFGSAFVVDHETPVLSDGLGQLLIGLSILGYCLAHVFGHYLTKANV